MQKQNKNKMKVKLVFSSRKVGQFKLKINKSRYNKREGYKKSKNFSDVVSKIIMNN